MTSRAIPPWDDPRVIWVCEEHPWRTWDLGFKTDCDCGAAGMPIRADIAIVALMGAVERDRTEQIGRYGGIGEWAVWFERFFRVVAEQSNLDRDPAKRNNR